MAIKTSIGTNVRKPGTFAEFDVTSAARGLVPLTNRVALVGARLNAPNWAGSTAYSLHQYVTNGGNVYRCVVAGTSAAAGGPTHASGDAADNTVTWRFVQAALLGSTATPTQMFTDSDADKYWGKNSELALMVRAALKVGAQMGSMPEIWAVALDDVGGAARQIYTITIAVTTAAAGDIVLQIGGRTIRAGVAAGDSASTIATTLRNAIESLAAKGDLPGASTISGAVVTFAVANAGVNGASLKTPELVSRPAGVTVTIATGGTGSGAYDITASLDTLIDKRYNAIAIANHASADISDLKAHIDARNAPAVKHFTQAYLAENGTLSEATTLATAANYKEITVVSAEDFPNLPAEIAAAFATMVESKSDPAYNFDGQELPLYLPAAASIPTNAEIETALAGGATILTANEARDRAVVVRWVTTQTQVNGVAFENLLDGSNTRSLFYSAVQVDLKLKTVLAGAKKNDRTKKRVKSVVIDVLRKLEEIEVLKNVETHLGEVQVEDDAVVTTRLNVAVPNSVVPNLHQLAVVHTLLIE